MTINVGGYMHSDFGNALETEGALENFRGIHALAYPGGTESETVADGPWLGAQKYLDLGLDPTFTTDSTAAILAWLADCNTARKVGRGMAGVFWYDPSTTPIIYNGAGFEAPTSGTTLNYDDDFTDLDPRAGTAMVFAKPYSANRNVPLFAVHRNGCIRNFPVIWYPDVVSRHISGAANVTTVSYPTLGGTGPDVYAPAIVTDQKHDDSGALLVGGRNTGGPIEVVGLGYTTLVHLGDPDPAVDTWATGFSTGTGKGVAVFDVYVKGFGLGPACIVETVGNFSRFRADLTPGYWTEASQMEGYPLIMYAQRHAMALKARRKMVGCDVLIRGRQMLCGIEFENATAFDEDAAGPDGQDRGKFANNTIVIRTESVPTAIKAGTQTFLWGNDISISGHFHEHDWTGCTDPVLDIQTHKDAAGTIDRDTGLFKSLATVGTGGSNRVWNNVQEATGPLLRNTANDMGTWIFEGPRVDAWGGGSKLTLSMIENLSADVTIIDAIKLKQCRDSSSKRLYDCVDLDIGSRLFVRPCLVRGTTAATCVVGDAAWAGFDLGVRFDADTITGDDTDEPE